MNNDLVFGGGLLDVIDDEDGVRTLGLFQFETQLFVDGVEDGEGAIGVGAVGGISGGGKDLIGGAEAGDAGRCGTGRCGRCGGDAGHP